MTGKTIRRDPRSTRAYDLPSCNACMRIAGRRGLEVGSYTKDFGPIESFTHLDGIVVACFGTSTIRMVPLDQVRVGL